MTTPPARLSAPCAPCARRRLLGLLAGGGALMLAGCAAFNQVAVDVSAFGAWPEGRPPGRYAFDRLPSQQAAAGSAAQQTVERAAAAALDSAGFQRVERPDEAEVLVRVGARAGRSLDPSFEFGLSIGRAWPRGTAGMRYPYPSAYGWRGWGPDPVWEQREADLLLVDRRSQQVLYEAHARLEGRVVSEDLLGPMFAALLQGFPALPAGERRLVMPITPAP